MMEEVAVVAQDVATLKARVIEVAAAAEAARRLTQSSSQLLEDSYEMTVARVMARCDAAMMRGRKRANVKQRRRESLPPSCGESIASAKRAAVPTEGRMEVDEPMVEAESLSAAATTMTQRHQVPRQRANIKRIVQ